MFVGSGNVLEIFLPGGGKWIAWGRVCQGSTGGVEGNSVLCLVVSEAYSESSQRSGIKLFSLKASNWMLIGLSIRSFDGFDFANHNENQ